MFGKLFFYLNQNLGKVFFGNPNSLYYNIFSKYHQNLISKKDRSDDQVKKYVNDGYFRTNVNSYELCNDIAKSLYKQKIDYNRAQFQFEIDDDLKHKIRSHINIEFKDTLNKIENFYNSKVAVAKVRIARNFHINNVGDEVYSNNYHVDHYTYNHFKLFINLMDVDICHGPLHLYSKNSTKKFLKKNKYKSRSNYNNEELENDLVTNTGKKGQSMIVNTTQCLHKAGFVEKGFYRDILFVTFITIPEKVSTDDFFYYEKFFKNTIWNTYDTSEILKIAKPKSLKKTISLFFKYYKNRIN